MFAHVITATDIDLLSFFEVEPRARDEAVPDPTTTSRLYVVAHTRVDVADAHEEVAFRETIHGRVAAAGEALRRSFQRRFQSATENWIPAKE